MAAKLQFKDPKEPGWYLTTFGKTYWTGKRWATKKHGKTVYVWGWMPIKIKLTPWFDGNVKPVRAGVYQTRPKSKKTFQHWNGKEWGFCSDCIECCFTADYRLGPSFSQSHKWRGILK